MNFNFIHRQSLKTRFTLFTLAIFLIGIWALAFYTTRILRDDMQRLLGQQQFATVSLVADKLNEDLSDRIKALQNIAVNMGSVAQDSPVVFQSILEQRPHLLDLFNAGVLVVRADGTAVAEVPLSANRLGVNYMDVDSIHAALKEGRSTVSKPVIGKTLRTPVFNVAEPIRDARGQIIGALFGVINLSKPNFLDKIVQTHYGKSGGYLLTSPQHKLFITGTDKTRIMQPTPALGVNPFFDRCMQGFEGYGVAVSSRGVEELAAVKGIPAAGWFLAIILPTVEAFAPVHDLQQRMLLATLVLTLLAGGLIWWMTAWMLKRQFEPMLQAARTLDVLTSTGQPAVPLPIQRNDEIGELITSFNKLLRSINHRENFLRQILDTSSAAIFLIDLQGRITLANKRMAEMFHCSVDDLQGKEYVALLHPDVHESGRQNMLALLSSSVHLVDVDRAYWRHDQTEFWGHLTGNRFIDVDGKERGLIGVIVDINERKQAEEKLYLAATVFTHAREAIMVTNADGSILDVNDAFTRITGYKRDDVLGQNPRILKSGRQSKEFYATMWRHLLEEGHYYGEVWNRRKNGEVYAEMQTISAVRDAQGHTLQYVALFSDITPLKEHQSQLEHIAHYDALTNLPNRVLLADRLHQAMTQAQRRDQLLAVVYLDLDGFKSINDRHGHDAGDQLLVDLANRMKQTLREGDTLARLGGDEFVAVLLDLPDVAASIPMLTRLLTAAAQPTLMNGQMLQVSASLGVTFFPQTEEVDADLLLRQADQSMYQAKLAGKNRYHVFDAEQDRHVRGHHESLERIREALTANEFVLYYQPKVNMRTGDILGFEALIRWQHPKKGLLPPAVFLPVIEDHPLAVTLGEWVINTALTQIGTWQIAGLETHVSVNISARHLQQVDFVENLVKILGRHPQVAPGRLAMEVLETSALEDLVHASRVIEACRQIGVKFALDDFGTGYSSLTYLKRLPVDLLKIDQSFVRDMLDDPDDLAILVGVIGLSNAFRRQVIAEGVETVAHGAMLLKLGCELAQGYGIARPMSAEAVQSWVAQWQSDPQWLHLPAVHREDLPVLFASAEHRAWIVAIESYFKGERDAPPPLDEHQCRFGIWLNTDGRARHRAHPAFQEIERLHLQAHALAVELLQRHADGDHQQTLERLEELHARRDAFLSKLWQLC
ncbi:EAL domain-containing protein [Rhodoferax sp.]|uniref:EAL domain-containing protein n=1 Tax=Rhodoferax sp. TaxID=50421 RepID=UPI0028447AAB|nr:EAL domain-containing protein [Rhodoferax sp.]MDR3370489.1 EAL domain-containing protein [Rhodoferax sp.]